MKFVIRAYKSYSEGARLLADKLDAIILKDRGSKFRYNPDRHTVINWGGSTVSHGVPMEKFINQPIDVNFACNKLGFFTRAKAFNEANGGFITPIPKFTTDKQEAQRWLNEGKKVCARATLTGNNGAGLTTHRPGDVLPDVPMYVMYVPKTAEYRVHVFNLVHDEYSTRVIKKKLKHDAPETRNKLIRNHENGYVFSLDTGPVPLCVKIDATSALKASGLRFGAVDIGYNEKTGTCIVYEINTAPGIEGGTVDWYAEQFRKLV